MLLAALLLALALWPGPAAADGWRRPVDAPVSGRFAYSPARPFSPGQRRGADFAAPAGAPVRAPCTGRVAYAGPVPGRGLGVTVRCGRLTATLLGLASLTLRRGSLVVRGAPVGRASGSSPLRLGARVTGRRFAYRDPLALLGGPTPMPSRPLAPPRGPRPRPGQRPPPPQPAAPPRRPAAAGPTSVPLIAWVGAGLLGAALSAGIALPRLRHRVRATAARRA